MYQHSNEIKPVGALHVAEVARFADVTPATVRYYARIKLLFPKRNPENGYKCFSRSDVHRIEFIRQAQALGLTIGEIKSVLATVDDGDAPCDQVKSLVSARLASLRAQIAELRATEARINDAVNAWRILGNQARRDGEYCPLIERVEVTSCQDPAAPRRQARRKPEHKACHCAPRGDTSRFALA